MSGQLGAQRVFGATLLHGDPGVLLAPGTKATLVWQRSYRDLSTGPLKHEFEAYAYNDVGHFVRIKVTDEMVTDLQAPYSE